MSSPITCLVTIHGLGFQQPPTRGFPGYADLLHENLSKYLDRTILSDDPNRERRRRGENGPIYVESQRLDEQGKWSLEEGMKRLGSWSQDNICKVDALHAPLSDGHSRIIHIALVYSELQPIPGLWSRFQIATKAALNFSRYALEAKKIPKLFLDTWARVGRPIKSNQQALSNPGLELSKQPGRLNQVTMMAMLRYLEENAQEYVSDHEISQKVCSFILDALLRLAGRDDVSRLVINSHSYGTMYAIDALRQLPPFIAPKIQTFITTGTPLRQLIDLYGWGEDIERLKTIKQWINFWDPKDPVGGPVTHSIKWLLGRRLTPARMTELPRDGVSEIGSVTDIHIKDIQVDNLKYSRSGGLQAHNYWDNLEQFIKPLAQILEQQVMKEYNEDL